MIVVTWQQGISQAIRAVKPRQLFLERTTPRQGSSAACIPGCSALAEQWTASGAITHLLIGAQVIGLILAASVWNIESPRFKAMLPWTGAGFAIHAALPRRFQQPFFVALSLCAAATALGMTPSHWHAATALLSGCILLLFVVSTVAACRLPRRPRAAILLGMAGGLALLRGLDAGAIWGAELWSLLGIMLMFRLPIFAEAEPSATPSGHSHRAAYLFMLPSVISPLGPVVDWATFGRAYFSEKPSIVYQKGVRWMARGLAQLILYRFVERYLYSAPSQVSDGLSLAGFLLGNYALYLRVSGLFHWLVGTLHLFGWNLPETNHHYFLAHSFTDYWRRVNIYWKDFMVKFFFTPVAFRMRGAGTVPAVLAGSATAFVATWALHIYQEYWVTGELRFAAVDALFWGSLGVLVMINGVREAKHPVQRKLRESFEWQAALGRAARTCGVFAVLCTLWSLWSADSAFQWLALWTYVDWHFAGSVVGALGIVACCKCGAEWLAARRARPIRDAKGGGPLTRKESGGVLVTLALSMALVLLPSEQVLGRLAPEHATRVVDVVKEASGSARCQQRGYYERLLDTRNCPDLGHGAP